MTKISYLDGGVPNDASGHPKIIITNGPSTISTNGVTSIPVYTPFPLAAVPMSVSIDYDP